MDRLSTKTWTTLGIIGLLIFGFQWARFTWKKAGWAPVTASFSYEMPRPQSEGPGFDISGREVERHITELPALPELLKTPAADPKTEATKKAALDQKKLMAKKEAVAKAQAAQKKKTTVDVVNTNRESGLSADSNSNGNADQTDSSAVSGGGAAPAKAAAVDEKDKEEETLTASQWRTLLHAAPTATNVAKFIKARRDGKVDEASYYQIIHELLVDSAPDRRRAALAILDQDVSATTFAFLVAESAQATADSKTQILKSVDGYSDPNKMTVLVRVLASSKSEPVLVAALTQLNQALTDFKKAQTVLTTGNRQLAGGYNQSQFQACLPSLRRLAQGTTSVAGTASTLTTEIQNLTAAK